MNKKSMSKMYKRILAMMLAFVMVVGMVPVNAFAEVPTNDAMTDENVDITSGLIAYYDFETITCIDENSIIKPIEDIHEDVYKRVRKLVR